MHRTVKILKESKIVETILSMDSDAYREYYKLKIEARLINGHTSSVKRKKWDGTRIPRITRIGTDDKISVGIRQIRAIRVLFQLRIENHNYLSHFEKRYALNQSNSLTDDQCTSTTQATSATSTSRRTGRMWG